MVPMGGQELYRLESPFHKNLMGHVDSLIKHLEDTVTILDNQEGTGKEDDNTADDVNASLTKTTGCFNTVLGGMQGFITGLHLECSNLQREAEELDVVKKSLEGQRDAMVEQSHDLHCRIQYSALEMKLDQSFGAIERCSSVESARCFKDEAHENLRRTQEIIRTANLRNCELDKEIFNQMKTITNTFEEYQKERETYVAEIDLFDDVRRRKISNWLKDSVRTETERELGETFMEYIDLSSHRRHLEPRVISNTLRMQSLNELLDFERQDNSKRLEEMMSLQQKVEEMAGRYNILPRKATATLNLTRESTDVLNSSCLPPSQEDDSIGALHSNLEEPHDTPGHGLHRCSRRINLATDPITEPELREQLESALRWEFNDGLQLSLLSTTDDLDNDKGKTAVTAGADAAVDAEAMEAAVTGTMTGVDPEIDGGGTPTTTSEDLQDLASVISKRSESVRELEKDDIQMTMVVGETAMAESATSLCGDAVTSQEKLTQAETDNEVLVSNRHSQHHHTPDPRLGSATALLHQGESATGIACSPSQQKLFFGLVKKKSGGATSSTTDIVDGEKEAGGSKVTSVAQRLAAAEDRETRSQGRAASGGRAGSSGTGGNSGNPRYKE